MPDQPLQPFGPPTALFNQLHIPTTVSTSTLIQWVLFVVFFFWFIYTIVAIYHWLKYSHASWFAIPSIALHLFISFVLMGYALSGTLFL